MIRTVTTLRLLWFSLLCLFLVACQSLPSVGQLPELNQHKMYQVTEIVDQQSALQSLLIIELQGSDTWRWIQLDALGSPISRQVLHNEQWRNDGFLPPNPQARALFIAVYVYISNQLGETDKVPVDTLAEIQIEEQAEAILLSFQNKQWLIKELPAETEEPLNKL